MKKVLGILLSVAFAMIISHSASASEFNPGRIIDDEIFYDSKAMGSAADVQRFIEQHTPACDTWGTGPSGYGNLTRAQYATQIKHWHGPPYACLQNYHENPSNGDNSFSHGGGAFPGGISAGQIIWDAAQRYRINPQVLLVMLRKESSGPLFADSWPLKSQYKYAMGYACPDSGPGYSANCDAEKAGFYKQVDKAAWKLRKYRNEIQNYNYQPGRVNRILYNPNPACGYKDVYIENYATASLYIYTPYVPNDAALAAYPGTAHCGAYGNRNFFYMFQEWFGSTSRSDIIGDISTGKLYLKSGNSKYYIPNLEVLSRLSTLSKRISYVSKQYIDSLSNGPVLNKTVRDPKTGAIYLIDSGYKLQFKSCEMLSDYGLTCSNNPDLEDNQLMAYRNGPSVTNYYQTFEDGRSYYISSAKRYEIYDQTALKERGLGGYSNRLSQLGIKDLVAAEPIVRKNTVIRDDSNGSLYYYGSEGLSYLNGEMYNSKIFRQLSNKGITKESISKLQKTDSMRGYVKDESGNLYLLGESAKYSIKTAPSTLRSVSSTALSILPTEPAPVAVKSVKSPMVYRYADNNLYPIYHWNDVLKLSPQGKVAQLLQTPVSYMSKASPYIPAATLVKSKDSPMVYMINQELGTKKKLYSIEISNAMGISASNLRTIQKEHLESIRDDGIVLDSMNCDGNLYVAGGGSLHYVNSDILRQYGLKVDSFEKYDARVCNNLSKGSPMSDFLLSKKTGALYKVQNGQKHYIGSYRLYKELGGKNTNTVEVTNNILSMIPSGNSL